MAKFFPLGVLLLFLILSGGCNETFTPQGPYEQGMVVYSILSPKSDTQYVRVYTTYNPSGYNPLDNTTDTPIRNAQITITESNTLGQFPFGTPVYQFRETILQRRDTSRYSSPVVAYMSFPMKTTPGKSYKLSVLSSRYPPVTSTIILPTKGFVSASNGLIITDPWATKDETITVNAQISDATKGLVVKFFIDYDYYTKDIGWRSQRLEIPLTILEGSNLSSLKAIYPKLIARTSSKGARSSTGGNEIVSYQLSIYKKIISYLRQQYAPDDIKFKQAILFLIQVETELYNYYAITNGFGDEKSIRLDLPEYTNIKGGVGVFGGFGQDSTTYVLPSDFGFGK